MAPERLEAVYAKNPLIDQLFIYGNSLQSSLVAVIIANPAEAEKQGFEAMTDELEKKKAMLKGTQFDTFHF